MELLSSIPGIGAFLGKLVDLALVKYATGAGLPGVLMVGSVAYMIFMVKNHVDPTTNNRLLAKGYIIRDLSKIAFAFMVFLAGAIFFKWPA